MRASVVSLRGAGPTRLRARALSPLPALRLTARCRGGERPRPPRRRLLGLSQRHGPVRALGRAPGRGRGHLLPHLRLPALPAVRSGPYARRRSAVHGRLRVAAAPANRPGLLAGADGDRACRRVGRPVLAEGRARVLRLRPDLLPGLLTGRHPRGLDAVRRGELLRIPSALGLADAARSWLSPAQRGTRPRCPLLPRDRLQGLAALQVAHARRRRWGARSAAAPRLPRPVRAGDGPGRGERRLRGPARAPAAPPCARPVPRARLAVRAGHAVPGG